MAGSPGNSTPLAEREVPVRRISFADLIDEVPKDFAPEGDPVGAQMVAVLSGMFPDGEDFFVRSVRHYRDQIDDPELKEAIRGFIGQESMHGREHRRLNDKLHEHGYPTKRIEKFTKWGLGLRSKYMPPIANLAATAALEHFTATLAEVILESEEIRDSFGDEAIRNIFVWHALEESEHKAVAFDVYKAVGGGDRLRRFTMTFFRYAFALGVFVPTLIGILADTRNWRRPGRIVKSIRQFTASPIISKRTWRQLKDYNRPDFHPNDSDTDALVAKWRNELFGAEGSLTQYLPAA